MKRELHALKQALEAPPFRVERMSQTFLGMLLCSKIKAFENVSGFFNTKTEIARTKITRTGTLPSKLENRH